MGRHKDKKRYFFDNPRNVNKLILYFYLFLIILIILDFLIPKHPHFKWEEFYSFYGAFGFVACVFLVLVAKHILRPIVKRKENYYD
ncbi:MAG: hypothetical protein NZ809_05295 [Thermodesulfovibrio sp.]|nr:hypothetical protein [Thermodesulfovibrio sp.]